MYPCMCGANLIKWSRDHLDSLEPTSARPIVNNNQLAKVPGSSMATPNSKTVNSIVYDPTIVIMGTVYT
jgi:hypothetical protein